MKTERVDVLLVSLCIILLVALSALGASVIPIAFAHGYGLLLQLAVFLFLYGLLTMLLLAGLRRKWPYPVGTYSLNSRALTYWKLNAVLSELATKALGPFRTVFTEPLLHAGLGARVGSAVAIAGTLRDHALLTIGERALIGQNSIITGHLFTGQALILKPVKIDRRAVIGVNCTVLPGADIGEGAVIAPGAVVLMDTRIPAGEFWGGVPARKIKTLAEEHDEKTLKI
ncbi:MAG: hypothetical protein NDJ90_07030 [Oligoflexia bacterium]|nr:hypothetical protein [Oligoflexia bacterium]